MKQNKLLLLAALFIGLAGYLMLISSSGGAPGAATTGCGGGSCHASGPTTISLTGVPAAGYTAGTTYTLTLTASNNAKVAAGFSLSATGGTFSAAPTNTALSSGNTEIHHTAPQNLFSGTATWTFNWTAPSASSVTFNIAANAVDLSGNATGDAWAITSQTSNLFSSTPLAPTVVTSNVSNIGVNSVTFNGTVNPNNAVTTVSFDYGTTVSYGGNVPSSPPTINGNTALSVTGNASGLLPATLYHFRVKATNSAGTTNGTDGVFITLPSSVPDVTKIGFRLYPNPAVDYLYIRAAEGHENFRLALTGVDGRYVSMQPEWISQDEFRADLRSLTRGLYFVALTTDGKTYQYPLLLR